MPIQLLRLDVEKLQKLLFIRKEEWFKVFLHETFHCFGLDFADMNMNECNKKIKKVFNIKTKIELYESYTETWAEIWNICFCSFLTIKNWKDTNEYLKLCHKLISVEIKFSAFQCVKVLAFMGLTYDNLVGKTQNDKDLSLTLYKENTNVFAYYILKLGLLYNYDKFYEWCKTNNTSIIQFKKTPKNLEKFCNFILNKDIVDDARRLLIPTEQIFQQCLKNLPKHPKRKNYTNFLQTLCV